MRSLGYVSFYMPTRGNRLTGTAPLLASYLSSVNRTRTRNILLYFSDGLAAGRRLLLTLGSTHSRAQFSLVLALEYSGITISREELKIELFPDGILRRLLILG